MIAQGDTLSEIAQRYGVTVDMLVEFNPGVKPLQLRIGARLIVPLLRKGGGEGGMT